MLNIFCSAIFSWIFITLGFSVNVRFKGRNWKLTHWTKGVHWLHRLLSKQFPSISSFAQRYDYSITFKEKSYYFLFVKYMELYLYKKCVHFTNGWIALFSWNSIVVLEKANFKCCQCIFAISLFCSIGKNRPLYLMNLIFLPLRMICPKFGWNWRIGSEKDIFRLCYCIFDFRSFFSAWKMARAFSWISLTGKLKERRCVM